MTVNELKDVLESMDDDAKVGIFVNKPGGWMCPDDCVVDVDRVCMGLDGYRGRVLVVPKYELDIHNVEEWAGNATPKDEKPKYEVMLLADGLLCSAGTYSTLREAREVKRTVSPKHSPYIREAVGRKGAANSMTATIDEAP